MQIIIHTDFDAEGNALAVHTIDLSATAPATCSNPAGTGPLVRPVDVVAYLNANPAARAAAGWNLPGVKTGYALGTTRWQILTTEANAVGADATIKALGLH